MWGQNVSTSTKSWNLHNNRIQNNIWYALQIRIQYKQNHPKGINASVYLPIHILHVVKQYYIRTLNIKYTRLFPPKMSGTKHDKFTQYRFIYFITSFLITVRNVVAARLSFHRHLWFCSRGGGLCIPACTGADTPRADTPWADSLPWADTPRADTPRHGQTPPTRRRLLRTVRKLLECILVSKLSCIPDKMLHQTPTKAN